MAQLARLFIAGHEPIQVWQAILDLIHPHPRGVPGGIHAAYYMIFAGKLQQLFCSMSIESWHEESTGDEKDPGVPYDIKINIYKAKLPDLKFLILIYSGFK